MEEEVEKLRDHVSYLAKEIDFQIEDLNFKKEEIDFKNHLLEESEKMCDKLSTALNVALDEKDILQEQIHVKNQTLEQMQNRRDELFTALNRTVDEKDKLQQQIDAKNQMLEQMQNRCDELFTAFNRAVDEKDELNQCHAEETRKMKSNAYDQSLSIYQENQRLKDYVECLRKELAEQAKDIERHEDQINLQKHFVTFAKKKLKIELDMMQEKTNEAECLEDEYKVLLVMQRKSNDELQEAREALLNDFRDLWSPNCANRRTIGIKRMGELDRRPFRAACAKKVPDEELDTKSGELCSFWQEQIQKSDWHPFRVTSTDENHKREIDEKDETLRNLKHEWGTKVHDVVIRALLEMNEYNASGGYPVFELWNFKEDRKASLKETIVYILNQFKTLKGFKRRRA